MREDRGLTVVEIMNACKKREIRGMYIMGENPAMSDPDVRHARAAMAKLEHLVVQDIFLTETAEFADVILPASSYLEKDGSYTNTDRRVQLGRKVMDPPGFILEGFDAIGQRRRSQHDRARTQLAYGEFLRRARRRVDARAH